MAKNSVARVAGAEIEKPRMVLKSVKPLLTPKPVSLRKNRSMPAKVSAWVMIEKYTPLIREPTAKKPKTKASTPDTSTTRHIAQRQLDALGRANVLTPVTNAHLVCHLPLENN